MALVIIVLGPVQAVVNGTSVDLGPERQRKVFAALLLDLGQPVPVAELIRRVWDGEPPHRPTATLRTYLSRLRALLPQDEVSILNVAGGYVLQMRREAIDLYRFRSLVAAQAYDEALRLWQGTPLDGLTGAWVTDVRTVLNEERTMAMRAAGAHPESERVPRQLPARPRAFRGRREYLADMAKAEGTTTVIVGIGGVGKTWLALHWAYDHVELFPDGQLFLNLRGFGASAPLAPAKAVHLLLDQLGVDPAVVPDEPEERAALYRSLVSARRMLVVLDNVRDSSQVAPLLPGGDCTVLVTSRNQLGALVARKHARRIVLDSMSDLESTDVLAGQLSTDRLRAEPKATKEIVKWCAGLPLALRIVAARGAIHQALPLGALAAELANEAERLDALDTGDTDSNLTAVFSWSSHALTPQGRRLFVLIGAAPTADVTAASVEALADIAPDEVRALLRELEAANLIVQAAPGRYRMHDLVHLYAAGQAGPERDAALRRITSFFLHTAHRADRLLDPERPAVRIDEPLVRGADLDSESAAWAWLMAERQNIIAMQRLAFAEGWYPVVWQLAAVLDTIHFRRGLYLDQIEVWRRGMTAARRAQDLVVVAKAHRNLGHILVRLRRLAVSHRHLLTGLAIAERVGDAEVANHCHHMLVRTWSELGDNRRALAHAVRSLELVAQTGDKALEAKARNQIGYVHALMGEYELARVNCAAGLVIAEEIGSVTAQAEIHDSLGYIALQERDFVRSLHHYEAALVMARKAGAIADEAETLVAIGKAHREAGDADAAMEKWLIALRLFREQHREIDVRRVEKLIGGEQGGS